MTRIEHPNPPTVGRTAASAAVAAPAAEMTASAAPAAESEPTAPAEAAAAAQFSATGTHTRLGQLGLLAYVLIFVLVCALPLAGLALGHESTNLEKRALAPLPDLLTDGRPNLAAMRAFDDYFADHFAFRTDLVSGWHRLNQTLIGQSGNVKVIAGKSGWLFFADTLPDYLATPLLSDADLRRLAITLALQQEHLAALGIDFHFTVAPNKNSIYGRYMPDRFRPVQSQNNLARWLNSPHSRSVRTINLLTPLRLAAAASDTPIYHRTDSHWNNLGARIGYETLMAAVSGTAPRLAAADYRQLRYTVRNDWQGDLAVMLSPSGVEPDMQVYFDLPNRYRSQRPIRSFEDLLIQTALPANAGELVAASGLVDASGRKLWMFRDSFANLLVPLLANSFASATFTREVPYNYTSIDKDKADVVILEIVERNLPQLLLRAPVLPAPERPSPMAAMNLAAAEPVIASATTAASAAAATWPIEAGTLLAEPNGRMLKLAGQLCGSQMALDTVDRILVGIGDVEGTVRYLEATPIDETAQMSVSAAVGQVTAQAGTDTGARPSEGATGQAADRATLGLTAFVPAGGWKAGSQSIEIWYRQANAWRHATLAITLP